MQPNHPTDGAGVVGAGVGRRLSPEELDPTLYPYSPSPQLVYGLEHYRPRTEDGYAVLDEMIEGYRSEGIAMPYTMEDFRKDYVKKHLKELSPQEFEEAFAGMTREQLDEVEAVLQKRKGAARSGQVEPPRNGK